MQINSHNNYYKLIAPEDILTAQYLSSSEKLKGRPVQETEAPWNIWWEKPAEIGLLNRAGRNEKDGSLEIPEELWIKGVPKTTLKELSWPDLLKKSVIKPEVTKTIAEEIIIMTADKNLFFDTIRKHFFLQQGSFQFTLYNAQQTYYLLKITNPSLWVLNTLKQNAFFWFNRITGHSGLYIASGYKIKEFSGNGKYNKLNIKDGAIILIQKDGNLLNIKPDWSNGEDIITIEMECPKFDQANTDEKLVIKPFLRATDTSHLSMFWKITDSERLKKIISNQSTSFFEDFSAWHNANGIIYLEARNSEASRDIASILSDAFEAFYEMAGRVYSPIKTVLSPKLSSKRLHAIMDCHKDDRLCIENGKNDIIITVLKKSDSLNMEDIIILEIEKAIEESQGLKPTWNFDFKELKKKR